MFRKQTIMLVAALALPSLGCVPQLIDAMLTPPHPPPYPRNCSAAAHGESLSCATFGFDLLATPNPGVLGPEVAHTFATSVGSYDGRGRVTGESKSECGCINALAQKADWLADNNYAATVMAACHCVRPRL
jgi:hypothetical protein